MKLRFTKPELTCAEIEKQLGLARGDVREITTYPDGTIEVEAAVELTSTQKSKLESLIGLKENTAQ